MNKFDVMKIRQNFPILNEKVHGKSLIYLDNGATTQKPQIVIDAVKNYYEHTNANIHRGVHYLSEKATSEYEHCRELIKDFIHAANTKEIVFTKGTTESINLVANCLSFTSGDEIIITAMEHHSNIVPWQMVCERTGANLKIAPMNESGELILEQFYKLLSNKTKLVACTHISNAIGTINPIEEIIKAAHQYNALTLIDGAQAVAHLSVNVEQLNCDFYVFSAHKLLGPTGVGVLYGKEALLEKMPPYQGGGDMIREVSFEKSTYAPLPAKFEAGTPNIAGVIGFAAAIKYINTIGLENIAAYEHDLLSHATQLVTQQKDLRLIGTATHKAAILSFVMKGVHAHDIGTILDQQGIAIRTGHHCAMPLMGYFKVPATARASFSFYNTKQEIDSLFEGLNKIRQLFHGEFHG